MQKYVMLCKKWFRNKYIKRLLLLAGSIYLFLFLIAFVMKDHANNDWVKVICHEYVYGPKNMVALVVNKFRPDTLKINSVLVPQPAPAPEPPYYEKEIKAVLERYKNQTVIDEQLKDEYESGGYTLDDPFIVVNPYGISPLTALVMFDTDYEAQIKVVVHGHNENTDVTMSPPRGHNSLKNI